jgi:alkylation response protein AidB-like acyl-CoA dehydrogenase
MKHPDTLRDIARLEEGFGDPWQAANPTCYAAVSDADERQLMLPAGEALLGTFGLNAEFVPMQYDGRLGGLGRLIAIMRSVFRRDPCLGLGYGASSFLAAVNVWTAGNERQRERVAKLLLANRRLACAYHELAHGNDIGRAECAADIEGDAIVLNGSKQIIANIARAESLLVYARIGELAGARSHVLLLLDRATAFPGMLYDLPRYRSSGMRGIALGGVEFKNCILTRDSMVGEPGRGLETALKAFQLSRIALPGMFAGIVDTGLRLTLRHCRKRMLYGGLATDLPLVRTRLAEAFADMLLCDCFTTVAANAARLLPRELSIHAAAVKALVPSVLIGAMNGLAAVLGAHSYLRDGDMALFQKLLRDLQPVGFGHASRMSCLITILPQLPLIARRSVQSSDAPEALFALESEPGDLPFEALSISCAGHDSLAPALRRFADAGAGNPGEREIAAWARILTKELEDLGQRCTALRPADLTPDAPPESFALASRYAVLLAASACIGIWRAQRGGDDAFLAKPAWLLAVLHRIGVLLGHEVMPLSESLCHAMFAELVQRYEDQRTFDLASHKLAESAGWH